MLVSITDKTFFIFLWFVVIAKLPFFNQPTPIKKVQAEPIYLQGSPQTTMQLVKPALIVQTLKMHCLCSEKLSEVVILKVIEQNM